jgi:hypothetical protein
MTGADAARCAAITRVCPGGGCGACACPHAGALHRELSNTTASARCARGWKRAILNIPSGCGRKESGHDSPLGGVADPDLHIGSTLQNHMGWIGQNGRLKPAST